jgi:hypothetical protein
MMYMCIYDLVVGMEALYVLVVGLYELILVWGYDPNHDIYVCTIW